VYIPKNEDLPFMDATIKQLDLHVLHENLRTRYVVFIFDGNLVIKVQHKVQFCKDTAIPAVFLIYGTKEEKKPIDTRRFVLRKVRLFSEKIFGKRE
jgi:hypothetical protein